MPLSTCSTMSHHDQTSSLPSSPVLSASPSRRVERAASKAPLQPSLPQTLDSLSPKSGTTLSSQAGSRPEPRLNRKSWAPGSSATSGDSQPPWTLNTPTKLPSRPGSQQVNRGPLQPTPNARPGTALSPSPGVARVGRGRMTTARGAQALVASKAAEARRAQEVEAAWRADHWRVRVQRAKRKLYLLLLGYMRWNSILKRLRTGYADAFTVELLPVFLANALGQNGVAYGSQLGDTATPPEEAQAAEADVRLVALSRGRSWLAKVRGKEDSSPPSKPSSASPPLPAASLRLAFRKSASGSVAAEPALNVEQRSVSMSPALPAIGARSSSSPDSSPPLLKSRVSLNGHRTNAMSRHVFEVEALRAITSAYLNKKARNFAQLKAEYHKQVKAQQVNLQLNANKANARWVEAQLASAGAGSALGPPSVLDINALLAGNVDVTMYRTLCGSLLAEGKVAALVIDGGEEQVVGHDARGSELREPVVKLDLWSALARLYPHKVPNGSRVGGLTALDRRVLQLILDAERAGGPSAAARLKVLLAVDSLHTAWVAEEVAARQHYGLAATQIVIVAMA
ncbi:hypothetical protein QJQ45_023232, partial [Haematococcus lacustris]